MTDINWNIFKAKFYQRETNTFENLSYQLFCFEHSQNYGIFRYKNQTGIETEPITLKNDVIGFQAKYYEVKLADKKADIIDSINKAKEKNPTLTILYIYLNKEFSESVKPTVKDPQYKIDIESQAKNLNVSIVWRVPSNFEVQLADSRNQHIAEYYFTNGSNIIDFIDGITNHTESVLYSIQNDIKYGNQTIHIDRSNLITQLKSPQAEIVIVNGDGGCGKTALIKDLYTEIKDSIPFYVFKAVEFNVQSIQNIFSQYGNHTFEDFLDVHQNDPQKIIVIDSAESLSEVNSQEVFKEFLSGLLKNSWQVIFTTRNNYLDDLRFQFVDVYRVPFNSLFVDNPSEEELLKLAVAYHFNFPNDTAIRKLLRNLFYMDEYLSNYDQFDETTNLQHFKKILWNKKIQNSGFTHKNTNIQRENCFLEIARERVNTGKFFTIPQNCSDDILALLQRDEIIKYDSNNGGYFITHDIYEEWALEVLIERAYNNSETYNEFIIAIGNSLAIRRSFRKWLSNKIVESISDIDPFINQSINDSGVDAFWKDEILITILLSEYSEIFFSRFQELIFENNYGYLKRIVFLLRIACKELDEFHNRLYENASLKYVFTKPKGSGWNSVISLIFNNLWRFDNDNINFFIPILKEWSNKNPLGKTSRETGLIALQLYSKIGNDEDFKYLNIEKQIVEIVLNTALEIKEELKTVFAKIISNDATKRDAPYFELVNSILTGKHENFIIVKSLPKEVIAIAAKFWIAAKPSPEIYYSPMDKEQYFGISKVGRNDYSPASAYQTPIYYLLERDFASTVHFIIALMNKVVESYQKSKFGSDLEEISLPISESKKQQQFISSNFWDMYRGSGHSPDLLQSVHMALEKYLLEVVPKTEDDLIIEGWLINILEKSKSASLTAVVASILKANPGKFFNVEKILFSSPEILMHDRLCTYSEFRNSRLGQFGRGWNAENKYYEDERDEAAQQWHRDKTLEGMIINYQFFRDEFTCEEIADARCKAVQEIIDDLYNRFPEKPDSSDQYMSKRLLIAQLDRRKMSPIVEQKDDKLLINLNPEIGTDLKEHSIEALKSIEDFSKYIPLSLWANNKFDNRTQVTNAEKYDTSPQLALAEVKEILNELNSEPEERFLSFNDRIPAFVCAALLKDFSDKFDETDLKFCSEIVLEYATLQLESNYDYQIADGVEVAISALPVVAKIFPETLAKIKIVLLLTLFDSHSIGEYKRVCDYAIETIYAGMLDLHGDLNHEFIIAFLKFKPLLEAMEKKGPRNWHERDNTLEKFSEKYEKDLEKFGEGEIHLDNPDLKEYSIENLGIVFKLIPVDTQNEELIDLLKKILPIAAKGLLIKDEDYNVNHSFRTKFFKRFAYFLLNRELHAIEDFVKPFIPHLSDSNETVYFLQEIIFAEDSQGKYEEFWKIWNVLYNAVILLCKRGVGRYSNEILYTYLLAWNYWKSDSVEWHSLKDRERQFYQKVIDDIGHLPAVLYSVSKILNGIGSNFLHDGIRWVSETINKQKDSHRGRLENDTAFYMENLVRKYIYLNREKVKKDMKIKNQVLIILNFLIERTSVNAYLLREDIL